MTALKPYTVVGFVDGEYAVHPFSRHVMAHSVADAWDEAVAKLREEGQIRSYELDNATEIATFGGHIENATD